MVPVQESQKSYFLKIISFMYCVRSGQSDKKIN